MQAASYEKQAKSSLSAARIVWSTEGLRGFYRGYGITIMREVRCTAPKHNSSSLTNGQIPFTSIQFPLYEYLKSRWASRTNRDLPLPAYEAAMCGCVAGGTAAFLTTPLDVLRTRIMTDMRVGENFLHRLKC